MLEKEQTIQKDYVFHGRIIKVRVDTVQVQNGNTAKREVVEHCGGVCVLALTEDNRALLVRQYRRPLDDFLMELPAGKLEEGEDPLECAKRELREETGYSAKNYVYLGFDYVSPGFCTEKIHIYLATQLESGETDTDDDEFVELSTYPLDALVEMVMDGTLCDAKTVIGILKAKRYLEQKAGMKK